MPRPRPVRIQVNYRKLRDIDLDLLREDIRSSFLYHPDVDITNQVEHYNTVLRSLLDKHAPQRLRFITLRPHSPWFNDALRLAKQDKRRCERKWKKTGLEIDKQIFKEQCEVYVNLISEAKTNYHKNKLSSCNQKSLFREVDMLVNGRKPIVLPSSISNDDLPSAFSGFFKTKVDNLIVTLDNTPTPKLFAELTDPPCPACLSSFDLVSLSQVESVIKKSPTKSCSLDPLPTTIVKECLHELLVPITHMINTSLSTGEFPSVFKIGCVTPIIKKPTLDADVLGNYRPITNGH